MARARSRAVVAADGRVDYRTLGELRYQIRRFLRARELAAREAGIEPQQHLLLLQVKALDGPELPTVTALANRLQITHHAAVQLVDRLVERGMVHRRRGNGDRRHVVIALRPRGEAILRRLAIYSIVELQAEGRALIASLRRLLRTRR